MKNFFLLLLVSMTVGCVTTGQFVKASAGDPEFDYSHVMTFGLAPSFWTDEGKAAGLNPLIEKTILSNVKSELEARGYVAVYVSPDELKTVPMILDGKKVNNILIDPVKFKGDAPDVMVLVAYSQTKNSYYFSSDCTPLKPLRLERPL